MAKPKDQSIDSKVLEGLLREEIRGECENQPSASRPRVPATSGPHWNVKEAKETPFVSDFFFSHSDKILGT